VGPRQDPLAAVNVKKTRNVCSREAQNRNVFRAHGGTSLASRRKLSTYPQDIIASLLLRTKPLLVVYVTLPARSVRHGLLAVSHVTDISKTSTERSQSLATGPIVSRVQRSEDQSRKEYRIHALPFLNLPNRSA